jgi:hypothetical protein
MTNDVSTAATTAGCTHQASRRIVTARGRSITGS